MSGLVEEGIGDRGGGGKVSPQQLRRSRRTRPHVHEHGWTCQDASEPHARVWRATAREMVRCGCVCDVDVDDADGPGIIQDDITDGDELLPNLDSKDDQ